MTVVIDKVFKVDGLLHRADGPAVIWKHTDDWGWYLFNDWHRYYGSPGIGTDWYIHGRKISK